MKIPKRSTLLHLFGTLKWTTLVVEIGHLAPGDGIMNETIPLVVALVISIGRLTLFLPLPLPLDLELDIPKP
jgi:hypothetical protein